MIFRGKASLATLVTIASGVCVVAFSCVGCALIENQRSESVDKILNVAQADAIRGDNVLADKHFEQAVNEAEKIEGNEFPLVDALNKYGSFKKHLGQRTASRALFAKAASIATKHVDLGSTADISRNEPAKNWLIQAKAANLGQAECSSEEGAFRTAENHFQTAIKIEEYLERSFGPGVPPEDLRSAKALYKDMLERERNEMSVFEEALKKPDVRGVAKGGTSSTKAKFITKVKAALNESDPSKQEAMLVAVKNESLARMGPRESEYRLTFSKLVSFYTVRGQFDKAISLVEADLLRYPVSSQKLVDADITAFENSENFIEDIALLMPPLRETKRYDYALQRGLQVKNVAKNLRSNNLQAVTSVYAEMARTYAETKQFKEALRWAEEALNNVPSKRADFAENRAQLNLDMARFCRNSKDWVRAKGYAQTGLASLSDAKIKSMLEIELLLEMEGALINLKEKAEAKSVFQRAISLMRANSDANGERRFMELVAEMTREAGDAASAYKRLDELESFVNAAKSAHKFSPQQSGEFLAELFKKKAYWLEADGKTDEAIKCMSRSVELGTKYDASKIGSAGRLNEAQSMCSRAHLYELAESFGRRAVTMCQQASDNRRDGPLVSTLLQLSYVLTFSRKYEEQRQIVAQALEIAEKSDDDLVVPAHKLGCYVRLANAEIALGLKDKALAHHKKSIEFITSRKMERNRDIRPSVGEIADNCASLGDYEGACRFYERLLRDYPDEKDPLMIEKMGRYADVLKALHRDADEKAIRKKLAEWK